MVKRIKQKSRIIFLVGIFFILTTFCFVANFTKSENTLKINVSDSRTIGHGEYFFVSTIDEYDSTFSIKWNFTSSNTNVKPDVFIMTEFVYENVWLINPETTQKTILSTNKVQSSGEFIPDQLAIWYIVFINNGSIWASTTITYSVTMEEVIIPFNHWFVTGPVLGVVLIGLIAMTIILYKKGVRLPITKKREKAKEDLQILREKILSKENKEELKNLLEKIVNEKVISMIPYILQSMLFECDSESFLLFSNTLLRLSSNKTKKAFNDIIENSKENFEIKVAELGLIRLKNNSQKPIPDSINEIEEEIELEELLNRKLTRESILKRVTIGKQKTNLSTVAFGFLVVIVFLIGGGICYVPAIYFGIVFLIIDMPIVGIVLLIIGGGVLIGVIITMISTLKPDKKAKTYRTHVRKDDPYVEKIQERLTPQNLEKYINLTAEDILQINDPDELYIIARTLMAFHSAKWADTAAFYEFLRIEREIPISVMCLEKLVEQEPENYLAWNELGFAYMEGMDFDNAIDKFEKAIDINPDYDSAWANLGVVYGRKNQHEKSFGYDWKALQINPHQAIYWMNIGHEFIIRKEYEKAIKCYEKSVELEPDNELFKRELNDILNKIKKDEKREVKPIAKIKAPSISEIRESITTRESSKPEEPSFTTKLIESVKNEMRKKAENAGLPIFQDRSASIKGVKIDGIESPKRMHNISLVNENMLPKNVKPLEIPKLNYDFSVKDKPFDAKKEILLKAIDEAKKRKYKIILAKTDQVLGFSFVTGLLLKDENDEPICPGFYMSSALSDYIMDKLESDFVTFPTEIIPTPTIEDAKKIMIQNLL